MIELLSALADWHTGLVSAVVPELVLGVVADEIGGDVFEVDEVFVDFELEPQPANANAASASVAVATGIERRDMNIVSSFTAGTNRRLIVKTRGSPAPIGRSGVATNAATEPRRPSFKTHLHRQRVNGACGEHEQRVRMDGPRSGRHFA